MTNTALKPFLHFAGCATRLTLATTLALLCVAPRDAAAQEWLKDRRYQEGAGIRTGDLELHPAIAGEVGYDSNFFLRSHKSDPRLINGPPVNPPLSAGVLRITPSLTLSTLSPQRQEGVDGPARQTLAFRAGVAATYREFLGPDEIREQRNIYGNAFARMDVLQNRPLGFGVFANYQRFIQPSVVADPSLAFNRSDVGVGGEVVAMPGGGTLDLRAGYQFSGGFYEQAVGAPFTTLTHELSVKNRWRFRPRTALFHERRSASSAIRTGIAR